MCSLYYIVQENQEGIKFSLRFENAQKNIQLYMQNVEI